jgi:TonB family protein
MNPSAGLHNFAYYLLQVGLLVMIGALLPRVFRIRLPKILLPYWQLLLIFCLLMPFFAPRQTPTIPNTVLGVSAGSIGGSAIVMVSERPAAPMIHWTAILWSILPIVISSGCVVRLGWLMIGWVKLKRMRRSARPPQPFALEVTSLIRRIGAGADILISPRIESAATFGIVQPVVLLPEEFETMDAETQASILAHELIHVRRYDWLFTLGEQLILAMFWYHPAIWWLTRRIELAREQVVDRRVLELAVDRRQYLKSLLHTVANRATLLSANLFFTRHHLRERVALLLEEIHMSKTRMITSLILVSMMLCLGAAIATYAFPLTGSAGVPHSRETSVIQSRSGAPAAASREESRNPEALSIPALQKEPVPTPAPTHAPAADGKEQIRNLVSGTVFDTSRARIPGVEISVADPETKEVIETAVTDQKGDFSFAVPAEQKVELTYRKGNFTPAVVRDVLGGQPPLRVILNLAMVSETVTIMAASLPAGPAGASATQKRQPIRIGGNVQLPKLIHKVDPLFPVEARQQGIEGIVMLQVYIGLSGEVLDTRVIKGRPPLDDAAIEAVRQWRYSPYLLNGEPQLGITTVTLIFKLDKQ